MKKQRMPNCKVIHISFGQPFTLNPVRFNLRTAKALQEWAGRLVKYLEGKT